MPEFRALLTAVDRRDWPAFADFLAADVRFRYGAQPEVRGRDAVLQAAAAAVAPFASVTHRIERLWEEDGGDVVLAGTVAYALADGPTIEVEFLNRFGVAGGKIHDYRIFLDPTPVFAALQASR